MALNTSTCNHLTPLRSKVLNVTRCSSRAAVNGDWGQRTYFQQFQ